MNGYEKWLWIELIGFDNKKTDMGVDAFLAQTGFVPHGISLLLWNPDLIHSHTGMTNDELLGETQCAYGARLCNEERGRQNWTKFQLRALIRELKKKNIEVYLSVFDQIMSEEWHEKFAVPKRPEWIDHHPELLYLTKDGGCASNICPWKHLGDGSLYEDFFIPRLCAVLQDYGADGFHGADGYAHPRFPINFGDFSDDMIGQFETAWDVIVPSGRTADRAEWILTNVRKAWTDFHSARQQQFWRKTVAALHAIGRKLIVNTAWTRDPFEAKYRYGVDYKMLAQIGIDKFIVEAPAAVVELEGWNQSDCHMLDKFMGMIMRIKAYVPSVELILLNCIKDGMEQYNVLRHSPPMLEADVFSLTNVFYVTPGSRPKRCVSGIMACLADGMTTVEWNMIETAWNIGFSENPLEISGATSIWSDMAFANEFDTYFSLGRSNNSYRWDSELRSRGIPLESIANIKDLNALHGSIVIINPCFFPEPELHLIGEYRNGPIIFVGADTDDNYGCSIYVGGKEVGRVKSCRRQMLSQGEVISWLNELPSEKIPEDFWSDAVNLIKQYSATGLCDTSTAGIRIWNFNTDVGDQWILSRNDHPFYKNAKIESKTVIDSVRILNRHPDLPVSFHECEMEIKVPPRGIIISVVRFRKSS